MATARPVRLLLALVLGLLAFTSAGCMGGGKNFSSGQTPTGPQFSASSGSSQVGVQIGNTAPDFSLKALDGSTVTLSDLRGKPVMVNFWATWCPPCKEEMPTMEAAYKKAKDQGIVFLGVDIKEDPALVEKFVKENGYSWTFLLDQDGAAGRHYQITGIPETFFIDRTGLVQARVIGPMTPTVLESRLAKIR